MWVPLLGPPASTGSSSLHTRIDPSTRIRRAIHLNDLVLLKRIIKNNPQFLKSPDYTDNGNTSLHLAARLGFLDIAEFLIDNGHEDEGISRNADYETPLHIAVEKSEDVALLIATRYSRCISWKNRSGADAIMLTARHPHPHLLSHLLSLSLSLPLRDHTLLDHPPNPLQATDHTGNTPLHYASAYGQLKSIRTLMEHGADAGARNAWSWTPVSYSASVQAEVYFKGLVHNGVGSRGGSGGGEVLGGEPGGRSRGGSGGERERFVEKEREVGRPRGWSGGRGGGEALPAEVAREREWEGWRGDGGRSRGGSAGKGGGAMRMVAPEGG